MEIFGVSIKGCREKEVLATLENSAQRGESVAVANLNPEILLLARQDLQFRELLNKFDLHIVDGFGVCLVGRIKYSKKIPRTPGADLAGIILRYAVKNGLKIGLINKEGGLSPKRDLEKKFRGVPNVEVFQVRVGEDYGKFAREKLQETEVLLAGLGAPEQERFIMEARSVLPRLKLAMGVGGTLDYWSGKQKRAPSWLRKTGLEWAHRFFHQPSRAKRIFRSTIIFPVKALFIR